MFASNPTIYDTLNREIVSEPAKNNLLIYLISQKRGVYSRDAIAYLFTTMALEI